MNLSKIAKSLGSVGGKKSAESRFKGKTKEEISEMMSKIRKQEHKIVYGFSSDGHVPIAFKREFAATLYPKGSKERELLNESSITSESEPEYKWVLIVPKFGAIVFKTESNLKQYFKEHFSFSHLIITKIKSYIKQIY